jgi:hypothetical protein
MGDLQQNLPDAGLLTLTALPACGQIIAFWL